MRIYEQNDFDSVLRSSTHAKTGMAACPTSDLHMVAFVVL
jgi:hypothetical protein